MCFCACNFAIILIFAVLKFVTIGTTMAEKFFRVDNTWNGCQFPSFFVLLSLAVVVCPHS